ncbi:MAG: SLC13/DASS family transporter [Chromatiales bacterium]|nr:MAG: SLC13/DASS family transporter [Chromatiales bacterium]
MTDRLRAVALIAGPVAALVLYLLLPASYLTPSGELLPLTSAARAAAGVGLWMAIWWLSEAIPIYATALLPLAMFPLTGATTMAAAADGYAHPLIYLFLGGFILALALERWGVHRRLALAVLGRVGTEPSRVIGAFMLIAAFISMWVTNTATTIMLLPVATSVLSLTQVEGGDSARQNNFAICLLLGIAYAASIGGIGTIIGTAPNLFVVSFIQAQTGVEISFLRWMAAGVPLVVVFVPLTWWMLVRRTFSLPVGTFRGLAEELGRQREQQGPMDTGARRTVLIFCLTALAWVTRPFLNELAIAGWQPLARLTDPGIAILGALALFVTPVSLRKRRFLMDWQTAVRLPWGLLILFGGGLSLAAALDGSGFSAFLGSQVSALGMLPEVLLVGLVVALMIFLTELTSNTATTATLIPVLFAVAAGLGLDPFLLVVPAGIAASCAFMLPVATPPNAIVFGSGRLTIAQMSRAGLRLNVLGIVLITGLAYAVILPVLRMTT